MTQPEPLDLTNEPLTENSLITLQQKDYILLGAQLTEAVQPMMSSPASVAEANLEQRREQMRGIIAVLLVLLLVVIVVVTLFLAFILSRGAPEDLSNVMQAVGTTVLTPIIGLIGAVTGFYYGGQRAAAATPAAATTPPREGDSR